MIISASFCFQNLSGLILSSAWPWLTLMMMKMTCAPPLWPSCRKTDARRGMKGSTCSPSAMSSTKWVTPDVSVDDNYKLRMLQYLDFSFPHPPPATPSPPSHIFTSNLFCWNPSLLFCVLCQRPKLLNYSSPELFVLNTGDCNTKIHPYRK